jgi:hypothetical protein
VRFVVTDSARRDYARLPAHERELFDAAVPPFNEACDRHAAGPAEPWPRSLRVRGVVGAPGIWEMTWSFAGPDGRATFEWIEIDGQPAIRWRRIGGHAIFGES